MTTRYLRKDRILKQEAAGTAVLLNMDSGKYYALDAVGGRVWDLCDGARTVSEIARILSTEYEAPLEVIATDVQELLTHLLNENLVGENK